MITRAEISLVNRRTMGPYSGRRRQEASRLISRLSPGGERNALDGEVHLKEPVPESSLADTELFGHAWQSKFVVHFGQKPLKGAPVALLDLLH